MRYSFIVNPNSRSGMGGLIWDIIEPELKKRLVEYESFRTDSPGHATKITGSITGDGEEHTLVVLGGRRNRE
ncbi:MAG: diacylglycerol kinase family protein [Clostridium sp.]|nr:diacylglycerol kinase family protein [Clostridium sp.]